MKRIVLVSIACSLIFFACDKVKNPYPKGNVVIPNDVVYDDSVSSNSNSTVRYALLEEYTGHKCPNCPAGAVYANNIDSIYGDTAIVVSIHGTNFATTNPGSGMYETDFNTEAGTTYINTFGIQGIPRGTVNRKDDGTNKPVLLSPTSWETEVKNQKTLPCDVKIDIKNWFSSSDKILKTNISSEWLNSGSSTYKLTVYIIEDNIIDWQLDGSTNIPNYRHRHVLRTALNSTWGTDIPASVAGSTNSQEFFFDFKNETWNYENCIIVAYIYDTVTKQVIQVTEAHVSSH